MSSVTELQLQLHKVIDTIEDKEKLTSIYNLLKGSHGPFSPMSIDEYVDTIDESKKQIRDGNFISVEKLEGESESW